MARPPLSLPLPRPGEAIVTTALAGALGFATWMSLPFVVLPGYVMPVVPAVAVPLVPLAFHWLRYGLVTAKNSPERGFKLPTSSTAFRICVHVFAYAALAAGGACALAHPVVDGIHIGLLEMVGDFFIGVTYAIEGWATAAILAILAYGLPLRAATGVMDATYPDVVDRALVRTHALLAMGAAFPLLLGAAFFLGAPVYSGLPLVSFATFVLLGLLAVAVPVGVALRAQRRVAARTGRVDGDFELVPIAEKEAERLARLPILGDGAPPTHALVRVAGAGNYRSAATPEEPLALIAVADEDRASLRSR